MQTVSQAQGSKGIENSILSDQMSHEHSSPQNNSETTGRRPEGQAEFLRSRRNNGMAKARDFELQRRGMLTHWSDN